MDAIDVSTELFSERLALVIAGRPAAHRLILTLTARLALQGSVELLDGGNHFDAFAAARLIRRQTHDLPGALQRIRVARAFTAYQMAALLERLPLTPHPKLVCDLLATFYDDSLPDAESQRLLEGAVRRMGQLSLQAPVLITASPDAARRPWLMEGLEQACGRVWRLEEPPAPTSPQLRLF